MLTKKKPKTILLSFRVDEDTDDKIHKVVLNSGLNRPDVIRGCLENGLDGEIEDDMPDF